MALSRSARISIQLGILFFCSMMGAVACGAIFPATQRLTAPLVCPSGTRHAVVVLTIRSSGRGTSTSGDLWCIDAEGGGHHAGTFKVLGALFAIYLGVFLVLWLLLLLVWRIRGPRAATLLLLLLGGCSWGTMSNAEYDKVYPYGRGVVYTNGGGKAVLAAFHARLGAGAIRVTTVYLDPASVSTTVQDRDRPDNLDDYRFADGAVGSPTPQKVSQSEHDELATRLFDLDAVPFDRMADIISTSLTASKLEGARVTSIQVLRGDHGVTVSVQIDSPRASATIELDPAGHVIEARRR